MRRDRVSMPRMSRGLWFYILIPSQATRLWSGRHTPSPPRSLCPLSRSGMTFRQRPQGNATSASCFELKRTWGVAVAALLYRARELGTMSSQEHRNSMIRLSDWGWRRSEPGDIGPAEQPTVLRRGLDLS